MPRSSPLPSPTQAATDAVDALAHLALFASAAGQSRLAGTALWCLETLLSEPDAQDILPVEYTEAGQRWLQLGGASHTTH